MRYRGFIAEYQILGKDESYCCDIYASDDDLRKNVLFEFTDSAKGIESVENQIQNTIDEFYDDIVRTQLCNEQSRYKELLGRAVTVLAEEQSPERLYETLKDNIGLSDDEIRKIGFTNLAPFFDRDGYAQTIAEFITDYGTAETMSGSYLIPFEEINKRFGVDLFHDEELLDKIMDSFDWDVISSLDITDGDFDLTFYTDYCPQYYDDFNQDWG